MVWLTAERTLAGEHFLRDVALELSADGRIRSLSARPPQATAAADTLLGPAAAWPLSSALPEALGGSELCSPAHSTWRAACDARASLMRGQLEHAYVETLLRLAHAGVGLVGLLLPAASPDDPTTPVWPGVAEACRAVARTGVRAALVFAFDEAAAAGRGLDVLCSRFDAGVQQVIVQQDARATWAMSVVGAKPWSADALISLRLRLGHLPLLVPLDAADGPCGRAWLTMWRERRCADSTVAFVAARAPQDDERHLLHELGCQWFDTRGRPSHVPWERRMHAVGSSLSLKAGLIAPGRWADIVALEATSDEAARAWLQAWPSAPTQAAVRALFVAGARVAPPAN